MRTMSNRADQHVVKVPVVFKIRRRTIVAAWIADRILRLRVGRDAYRGIVLALEDMEYQEIAAVLGISETNVGVRLNRARASLRKLMGEGP